jgi:hypothetical protein
MANGALYGSNMRGRGRRVLLRYHRLFEFERVFSDYIEGKTTADHVRQRAKLMLEAGLPRKLK